MGTWPEVTIQPTPLVWMGDQMPNFDEVRRDASYIGWSCWAPEGHCHRLSTHYLQHVKQVRRPVLVWVPFVGIGGALSCTPFVLDQWPTKDPASHWDVEVDLDSLVVGDQPKISVHPSIHLVGFWHGWLKDGVLSQ